MSWKTVLSDTAKFGDDKKVMFEGVELTLGELRTLNKESEGSIAKQLDDLAKDKQELATQQQETAAFYNKLLETEQTLKTQAAAAPQLKPGFNPLEDPTWQPILKPLAERIEAIEKQKLAALENQVKAIGQAALQMAQAWTEDKWNTTYSTLPKDEATKAPRFKMEELVETAKKGNLLDPVTRIYDIKAAYDKLDGPRQLEELRQKAIQEGVEKGRQEALMASMPRSNGGFSSVADSMPGFKPNDPGKAMGIDAALELARNAAMKDPDILNGLHSGF